MLAPRPLHRSELVHWKATFTTFNVASFWKLKVCKRRLRGGAALAAVIIIMQSYQVLHATLIIHVNNLLFLKVDMVLSCIVFGCNNNSTDPRCYYLQWHRLPSNQEALEQLRRVLKIPNDILVHSKKKNT